MGCHVGPDGPVRAVDVRAHRRLRRVRRRGLGRLAATASGGGRRWGWPAAIRSSTPRSRARSADPRASSRTDPARRRGTRRDAGRHLPALPRRDGQAAVRPRSRRPGEILARPRAHRRRPTHRPHTGTRSTGRWPATASSCAVCHRMQPTSSPRTIRGPTCSTSWRPRSPATCTSAAGARSIGPFQDDDIAPYAMEHATGSRPKDSEFLRSSQCAARATPSPCRRSTGRSALHPRTIGTMSCIRSETVPLFRKFHHHVEQATYLEWLNSEFENEIDAAQPARRSRARTATWRRAEGRAATGSTSRRSARGSRRSRTRPTRRPRTSPPHDRLNVRLREEGYRRHNFAGLNAFLVELFDQFDGRARRAADGLHDGLEGGERRTRSPTSPAAATTVASLDVTAESRGARPADGARAGHEQGRPSLPERRRLPPGVPGGGRRAARAGPAGRRSRSCGRRAGPTTWA